ncbi:glutamic-type intramembrane protease PrsW [Aneurinibacillus sp. Ricciae_BoGa-3]|uniref:glutamic-type intramembrane protease PrsW n=1 Tax=Aneurinibacillus sp. Ricciae_BoGa-3 TaxID=3022697 RepID=UPI002342658C|nr:glutamic-type intramembrane protease PrsW [Aneurinibacillus sp. Ricciae_BoGa-3]WCK56057.1 glutamic-type intramembrane protease PrsW [Aneurinibacillus sp. Ricciae_BoGa-3]
MLTTLGAAIAPGIAILSYFYLKDKYEMEPLLMVIKTFIYGILIVFPVMLVQYGLSTELAPGAFMESFVLAGFLEESFKWAMIYYTAYKHVEFDEPYDGIVYAAAVSLGFATVENFLYLLKHGLSTAFFRALLPVSSHGLFGVMMGYYMGKAKFSLTATKRRLYLTLSLLVSFVLHGTYDYILNSGQNVYLWLIIPFMAVLWIVALDRSRQALRMSISYAFGRKYDQEV